MVRATCRYINDSVDVDADDGDDGDGVRITFASQEVLFRPRSRVLRGSGPQWGADAGRVVELWAPNDALSVHVARLDAAVLADEVGAADLNCE